MKFIKKTIFLIFLILLIVISFLVYKGHEMYKSAISEISLEDKVNQIEQNSDFVEYKELPKDYINAVVATEDHRFYDHCGIDVIAIARAIVTDIKAKDIVEGGSTITQQLAKNMYFTQKKEIVRKIAEMFLTFDIEKNYSKERIFTLYVNTSYFGDGYYGIGQATKGYLNKEPSQMTLKESTLMAGIPNAPSVYSPTKNPDLAFQRQKQVISKMVKYKYMSKEKADEILK